MVKRFIDVASYQPATAQFFDEAKAWGCEAVVIKLTEGGTTTKYVNPNAREQIRLARERDMQVHAYHYFLGVNENDARGEAEFFVKTAQEMGLDPNKTIMIPDVEDNSLTKDRQALTNYTNAFIQKVKDLGYPHTSIYTGRYWSQTRLYMEQLIPNQWWLAEYGTNQCNAPCTQWQYSSTQKFAGVNTDVNLDYTGFFTKDLSADTPEPAPEVPKPDAGSSKPPINSWVDDLGVRWYGENGKYTLNESTWLRWGATTSSSKIALLSAGSTIKYDAFAHAGGYVWLRQPRGNGQYGYLASGRSANGKRLDYWGKFS